MFYRPRLLHRVWAWIRGQFWVPCPICKRGFAEHEWLDGHELWLTDRDSVAVCPNCGAEAARLNAETGFPPSRRPEYEPEPIG